MGKALYGYYWIRRIYLLIDMFNGQKPEYLLGNM